MTGASVSGYGDQFPPGFVWSDEDERPVYVSQGDDGSGSIRADSPSGLSAADLTGVPHLARAVELLWEAGHPRVAEAVEREVSELIRTVIRVSD